MTFKKTLKIEGKIPTVEEYMKYLEDLYTTEQIKYKMQHESEKVKNKDKSLIETSLKTLEMI
mgnify:CR=1 FL=1